MRRNDSMSLPASLKVPCVQQCLAMIQRGQYSEQGLIAVRDFYRVDSVLFIKQADYYPYTPPRMAVSANLVDAETGETVAAVDGSWDADDQRVAELMHQYARDTVLAKRLNNPEFVAISPTHFGKFVAHELADSICRLMRAPAMPPMSGPMSASDGMVAADGTLTNVDGAEPIATPPPVDQVAPTDELAPIVTSRKISRR